MPTPAVRASEQVALNRFLIKWLALVTPLGLAVGTACAVFLWSLDFVTQLRFSHPELVWLLPLAGAAIGWVYSRFGSSVEGGNNQIVDEIHQPGGGVPLRMAPLILFSTIVTHLFGGSAGREGTAVQMGGSIASGWAQLFPGLTPRDVRIMLMAGVSAGFGGVFGTPLAGTVFAMEVLAIGRMYSVALIPCLLSAIMADQTCLAWGIGHTHYHVAGMLPEGSPLHLAPMQLDLLGLTALVGLCSGLTSVLFADLTHALQKQFRRVAPHPVLRPALGGVCVLLLMLLVGNRDYLGLGVSSPEPGAVTIVSCFQPGGALWWSWLAKLLFTSITLSSGFKGGEVTPLFFIGAALGNMLATQLGLPVDFGAALGFLAVFSGATNTPIACTLMGIELFGGEYAVYFGLACTLAYLFSGHSGIYSAQRIQAPKVDSAQLPNGTALRNVVPPAG